MVTFLPDISNWRKACFALVSVVIIAFVKSRPAFFDVERFAEVFRLNAVRSVTTVVMEVPCCAGLPRIVEKGIELSGRPVAQHTIVISRRGEVVEDPGGRLTPLEAVVRRSE